MRATSMTNETHQSDASLLEVAGLKTYFKLRRAPASLAKKKLRYVKAVDDVSISVRRHETVGIVGESGCGKTTLARTIVGLAKSTSGSIKLNGKELLDPKSNPKERFKHVQIVFQDYESSLDPRMKIIDTLNEPLIELTSLRTEDRHRKISEVLQAVGLGEEFLQRLPKQLSGGQKQRVNIARALISEPKLIILDEPTSALDASVQAQILNLLIDLQEKYSISYLIITHNIAVAEYLSDRIYVMYAGKIVEQGPSKAIISVPRQPYTLTLIASAPIANPRRRTMLDVEIRGEVPSVIDPPNGCRFHPRCPYVEPICSVEEPQLENLAPEHKVACHFVEKTESSLR